MYSNAHLAGTLAAFGVITTVSGWSVAGFIILAAAVILCGIMTVSKLHHRKSQT